MSAQTLPVLTHPDFPQVFISAIAQLVDQTELVRCYWSDEHCDCRAKATVHDLKSQQEFCLRHFQAVRRG